jgi:hypothetical protein
VEVARQVRQRQWAVTASLMFDIPQRTVLRWQQMQVAVLKIAVRGSSALRLFVCLAASVACCVASHRSPPPPRCVLPPPPPRPNHSPHVLTAQAVFVEHLLEASSPAALFQSLAKPKDGTNASKHMRIISKVVAHSLSFPGAVGSGAAPSNPYADDDFGLQKLAGAVVGAVADGVVTAATGVLTAATDVMGAAVGAARRLFDLVPGVAGYDSVERTIGSRVGAGLLCAG